MNRPFRNYEERVTYYVNEEMREDEDISMSDILYAMDSYSGIGTISLEIELRNIKAKSELCENNLSLKDKIRDMRIALAARQ